MARRRANHSVKVSSTSGGDLPVGMHAECLLAESGEWPARHRVREWSDHRAEPVELVDVAEDARAERNAIRVVVLGQIFDLDLGHVDA